VLIEHCSDLLRVFLPVGLLDLLEMQPSIGQDGPDEFQIALVREHPRVGGERAIGFQEGVRSGREDEPLILGAKVAMTAFTSSFTSRVRGTSAIRPITSLWAARSLS
jgi:hypothetical protein